MKTLFYIILNFLLISLIYLAISDGIVRTVNDRWEWQARRHMEIAIWK